MEITAVLYFLRKGVKLHFYSLGTIFEENIWGVQRGACAALGAGGGAANLPDFYYSIDHGDYPDAVALVAAPPRPSDSKEPAVMEWINYLDSPSEMPWDGRLEIDVPQFPVVTFRWYSEKVEAVTENGIVPLYYGMPIWNAYFRDLTGDGLPELCSTVSYGSGMIDTRVIVYDHASGIIIPSSAAVQVRPGTVRGRKTLQNPVKTVGPQVILLTIPHRKDSDTAAFF